MAYPDDFTMFSLITDCPSGRDYDQEIDNLILVQENFEERLMFLEIENEKSGRTWKVFI